jgi:hypothetical protein
MVKDTRARLDDFLIGTKNQGNTMLCLGQGEG